MTLRDSRFATALTAAALVSLVWLASPPVVAADRAVIFLVRHAERADEGAGGDQKKMMGNDPPLSKAGEERAKTLASMLRAAGIKRVYTTEFRRTRDTGAALATAEHIEMVTTPAKDTRALLKRLNREQSPVLVVAHSDTIPDLLHGLGIRAEVKIGDREYDNLFVIVRNPGEEPTLIRLKY
jgi:broad specificity phosphatase PhoE